MADKFPALKLMGVNSVDQIQSYTLTNADPSKDVLRIKYKRPAGSFLPKTRSYEFDRTPRASDPSATGGDLTTYEISPILNDALVELDSIVNAKVDKEAVIDGMLEQLGDLEREFAGEIANLRAKLNVLRKAG